MDDLLSHDVAVKASLSLCSELNDAILERKEGIVLSNADILAGHDLSAALADDYIAGEGFLTVIHLYSEVFRL